MVNPTLEQAWNLKQVLLNFVLDAEGDLAIALETYVATQLKHRRVPADWLTDEFLDQGTVRDTTPIALFMEEADDLTEGDRALLNQWQRTFTGLFAVEQVLPDGLELINWLTAKHYIVQLASAQVASGLATRLKPGEIILTRLAPVTDPTWMIATTYTLLGKLGKPKLAVAIGNFKDNHKRFLYADAPELLEEAWRSVERYHHLFLDFFGSDEVTMPGYQLNQKMQDFQDVLTKHHLAAAGLDGSTALEDLAIAAEMDEADLKAAAEAAGLDENAVSQFFTENPVTDSSGKMAPPQIQLPDAIKKAEQVTVLTHPRWGQMFLPNHTKMKALLAAEDWQTVSNGEKLIRHYLDEAIANTFVWRQLAQQYPQSLEQILRSVLHRPDFTLATDLDSLLQESGKPLEPELPEIASVPIHLHNLFTEAVQEVNKTKPKGKEKAKKTGFSR